MNNSWVSNNYIEYIELHFPQFFKQLDEDEIKSLRELYFSISDIYITCNFFDRDEYTHKNYINLIKEFKSYISRQLIIIPLNDKYLIDSIFRLLIEKLYRILYAIHHQHLLESSIRKHSREKMSSRLVVKVIKKTEIDTLYGNLSSLIHHTISTPTDILNFKQLAEAETGLISYTKDVVEQIKEVYTLDFLIPLLSSNHIDLASKITFSNDLQKTYVQILESHNII